MFEEETEADSEEVRGQRFEKIMMAMQKVSVSGLREDSGDGSE